MKARALQAPDNQSQSICVSVDINHNISLSQDGADRMEVSRVLAESEIAEEPIEELKPSNENESSLPDTRDGEITSVRETTSDDDLECLEAQMDDILDISAVEDPKEAPLNDDLNLEEEEDW